MAMVPPSLHNYSIKNLYYMVATYVKWENIMVFLLLRWIVKFEHLVVWYKNVVKKRMLDVAG